MEYWKVVGLASFVLNNYMALNTRQEPTKYNS